MVVKVTITLYVEDEDWVDEEAAIAEVQAMDDAEVWGVAHAINHKYQVVE